MAAGAQFICMKVESETALSKITLTLHLCKVPGISANIAACSNPFWDTPGILERFHL